MPEEIPLSDAGLSAVLGELELSVWVKLSSLEQLVSNNEIVMISINNFIELFTHFFIYYSPLRGIDLLIIIQTGMNIWNLLVNLF